MTDELFSVPVVLSPKLAWMQRHGVAAYPNTKGTEWIAGNGATTATGPTEEDAIVALAKANGWRLWNEENL